LQKLIDIIARAEEQIQLQRRRIERSQAQGIPEGEHKDLLATMLESLALMKHHRDLILARLADLGRSP
jgi:hypothetical protein